MATIFTIGAMMYFTCKITSSSETEQMRMGYMWALAFFLGFLVGPAMHHIADVDPSILINAVAITSIMFASFSAISLYSSRRSYLFLGGIISSLLSCMFWFRLGGYMFGYSVHGMPYLLLSLFVACMYIIYDTQMIIERSETMNMRDVPTNTMILFLDLFDLFIKIVQLLMELQDNDKKKKKRDD